MTTERERFEQEWYSQRAAMSRMDVAWHFWQAALAGRDAAPPSLTFTLREADQLLGTFGDEARDAEVLRLRKILAHVPPMVALAAKEAAGYGAQVRANSMASTPDSLSGPSKEGAAGSDATLSTDADRAGRQSSKALREGGLGCTVSPTMRPRANEPSRARGTRP